jgi:TATA-box binding protein (TBP) (component of TFIID and TFIIIB)
MPHHDGVGVKIRTVNIVARSSCIPPFSLAPLSAIYPFDSGKDSYIAVPHHRALFYIYNTGKIVSFSSKSIKDFETSFKWLQTLLSRFGINISDTYEITNIVAIAQIAPPLELLQLVQFLPRAAYDSSRDLHPSSSEYLFDAIIYHFQPPAIKPRQTALIFRTGRATFAGFQSRTVLHAAARLLAAQIAHIIEDHPEVLARAHSPNTIPLTTASSPEVTS